MRRNKLTPSLSGPWLCPDLSGSSKYNVKKSGLQEKRSKQTTHKITFIETEETKDSVFSRHWLTFRRQAAGATSGRWKLSPQMGHDWMERKRRHARTLKKKKLFRMLEKMKQLLESWVSSPHLHIIRQVSHAESSPSSQLSWVTGSEFWRKRRLTDDTDTLDESKPPFWTQLASWNNQWCLAWSDERLVVQILLKRMVSMWFYCCPSSQSLPDL